MQMDQITLAFVRDWARHLVTKQNIVNVYNSSTRSSALGKLRPGDVFVAHNGSLTPRQLTQWGHEPLREGHGYADTRIRRRNILPCFLTACDIDESSDIAIDQMTIGAADFMGGRFPVLNVAIHLLTYAMTDNPVKTKQYLFEKWTEDPASGSRDMIPDILENWHKEWQDVTSTAVRDSAEVLAQRRAMIECGAW